MAESNADLFIGGDETAAQPRFVPADILDPDVTYDHTHRLQAGGTTFDLNHARGETDDQTWVWLPKQRTVLAGDFLIWDFPSAGNPQKVQRYPDQWATALRTMIAAKPELLVPAHGLPIAGSERIALVLGEVASVLERLVGDVIDAMNAGATLDEVVQSVRVDPDMLDRPWLRPLYDEPEFVVRNVWRLYGGWWDSDLAHLKPPCRDSLAIEVAALAGGAPALAARAATLADGSDLRLACQLIEWAHSAAPHDSGIAARRRALYRLRSDQETSLMAKGIFRSA
jgi:alkyl sulfatase BDS1-like metallo-beta-lactamase superfamily hydrolase